MNTSDHTNKLAGMLPPKMGDFLLKVPEEYFYIPEEKLVEKAYGPNKRPLQTDRQLKYRIWDLFNRYQHKNSHLTMAEICKGICYPTALYKLMEVPERLAYVCIEPFDYWVESEDLFRLSVPEMKQILMLPMEKDQKTNRYDVRLMDLKFKIFQYIDQRQNGTFVQKIETKSLNVNVDATQKANPKTIEEVDAELQKLRKEALDVLPPQQVQPILLPVEQVKQEAGKDLHGLKGDQSRLVVDVE